MFKQRRVRHSTKFSSRIRSSARHQREYAASVYSTAGIQFALAIVLALAAWHSYRAISVHAGSLRLLARMSVPGLFLIAAVFAAIRSLKNIKAARAIWTEERAHRGDDDRPR